MLCFDALCAAHMVDRAILRSGSNPRRRIVGDAGHRPLFQRSQHRILREFLRHADVTGDSRDDGNDAGRLESPDGFD